MGIVVSPCRIALNIMNTDFLAQCHRTPWMPTAFPSFLSDTSKCAKIPWYLAWPHVMEKWVYDEKRYEFQGEKSQFKKEDGGASLVAQWLRIRLPTQGTRVRALVWEDPTCRGATRPVSHNYWACVSGACAPQREAVIVRGPRTAIKSDPHLPQQEKALAQKWRPNTPKNK